MHEPSISKRIMHLLARNNNPPVILFPVNYNGVNFARALHAKGVDVVGILDRQKNPDHALAEMRFPVVFKPRYRADRWHKANLPKATMYSDADELLRFYHRASEHENVFVLSEFVEGPDSNLWNSHYYYSKGEPRAIYTDQKIRQYPATLGTCLERGPHGRLCTQTGWSTVFYR